MSLMDIISIKMTERLKRAIEAIGACEVFLIDSCSIGRSSLAEIKKSPGIYFTTERVVDEFYRWAEKERNIEVVEKGNGKGVVFRKGIVATLDRIIDEECRLRDEISQESKKEPNEPASQCAKDAKLRLEGLKEEKTRLEKEYPRFFNTNDIIKYFENEKPGQIIKVSKGFNDAFERYSGLLTKRIAVDLLDASERNRRDFQCNKIKELSQRAAEEYEKRLADSGLGEFVRSERIEAAKAGFERVYQNLFDKYQRLEGKRKSIYVLVRCYLESLKNDLGLVWSAFNKRFSVPSVIVKSDDLDVREMIDYVNAARNAGKLTTINNVCYST